MTGPDDFTLKILLEIKAKLDELTKTKKAMSGLRDEAVDANKKMGSGFSEAQKGLRGMIKPLTTLRMTIFQFRMAWMLTFGAIAVSIANAVRELQKVKELSIDLSMAVEDLGMKMNLVRFDEENLDKAENLWNNIGAALKAASIWVSTWIANIAGMDESIILTEKQAQTISQLEDATRRLTMTTEAYGADKLYRDFAKYSLSLEKVPKDMKERAEEALYNWRITQEDALARSSWGFQTWAQEVSNIQRQFGSSTSAMFSNVFIDGLDNKLASSKEIFRKYLLDLRNEIIRFMINQAVWKFMSMFLGGGNVNVGMPTSAGSTSTAGTSVNLGTGSRGQSLGTATFAPGTGTPYGQFGGDVEQTGLAVIHKGEHISSPYNKEGQEGGGNYNIYIQAVDAPSFVQLLNRNPEAIVTIVDKSIKNNQAHRRTIRYGR